ncbi:TPA: 2,3,4,5-tetrahydropyridine-2,6-dicarboxylate N-succinyltransferase [Candidatus Poribacteria bacterium]|nr:2,3,4,5-tetrahydropyridine-2,6-dicarboxylate N-succinyltransferase [Candidatus Poribacteria bacterium]HIM11258.1 2,3,4,5-tetrahydropyridine-2,6-dicarboxylate N-succinyltransferase [Candidatus Poribacteria bacterium]HIO81259.1 2,3,4,5-tetrahydropyridine-2,6-dicarboxylate N-succinyltransferase [Candidatus Poribacteria bacterium]
MDTLWALGIGFRRKRCQLTLDVTFAEPQKGAGTSNAFLELYSDFPSQNGFVSVNSELLKKVIKHLIQTEEGELSFIKVLKQFANFQSLKDSYHETDIVLMVLYDPKQSVESAEEAYFKLHCLSHRTAKPHDVSMDGAFGKLTNVAWSNQGPLLPEDVPQIRWDSLCKGDTLQITHVDKFPYLVNYHLPEGVRIVSGSQVRLGAHLGHGTTVMPTGYVNFNAGSSGSAMIEGRVSAGVFIGDDTDIGGGASIMGTLSGGNEHVISVADNCLLGANAGIGISLGKGCTVEAGLYITAGMKISLVDEEDRPINLEDERVEEGQNIFKAMQLSGREYCLFIRDSRTGQILCKPNKKIIELNKSLHAN